MADDAEEQAAELEALRAIFGDDSVTSLGDRFRVCISDDWDAEDDLLLEWSFPSSYPSSAAPEFSLRLASGKDLSRRDELQASLLQQWEEADGAVILYTWIEYLRDQLPELLPKDATLVKVATEGVVSAFEDVHAVPTPDISHGEPLVDRKSTFQAHAAVVRTEREVEAVVTSLLANAKVARATHNIMAFRLYDEQRDVVISDNDDDGETAAGGRLAELLAMTKAENVVVVVSRWYGGIHLGPDRFKHINNVARRLLEEMCIIEGGRKGKKR